MKNNIKQNLLKKKESQTLYEQTICLLNEQLQSTGQELTLKKQLDGKIQNEMNKSISVYEQKLKENQQLVEQLSSLSKQLAASEQELASCRQSEEILHREMNQTQITMEQKVKSLTEQLEISNRQIKETEAKSQNDFQEIRLTMEQEINNLSSSNNELQEKLAITTKIKMICSQKLSCYKIKQSRNSLRRICQVSLKH